MLKGGWRLIFYILRRENFGKRYIFYTGRSRKNPEYDEAKNEQAQVEERIAKLEMMVRNAKIIDEKDLNTDVVNIGSSVKVRELDTMEEDEYTIVGSAEADPLEGKISNESPVGSKLLGNRIGDVVEVEVPDGIIKYEICGITI